MITVSVLSAPHRLKLGARRGGLIGFLRIDSIDAERERVRLLRHPLVTAAALARSATQIARVILIAFARRVAHAAVIQAIIINGRLLAVAILVCVRVVIE